jgi:unsaturated rhamnogalacturonyl hydrolase
MEIHNGWYFFAHFGFTTAISIPNRSASPDKLLFQVDLAPGETRTFYILDASALAAVPPPIVKTICALCAGTLRRFCVGERPHRASHLRPGAHQGRGHHQQRRGRVDQKRPRPHRGHDVCHETLSRGQRLVHGRLSRRQKPRLRRLGIWDGKKLFVSSNWKNWKLITTGPIRSEFEVTYDAWDAGNGRKVSEVKRFSIDAGSWLTKVSSTFPATTNRR